MKISTIETSVSEGTGLYKVVLVFDLKPGSADEELRRSVEPTSFPALLSQQPGFVELELVKVSPDRTLSIQTWQSEPAFFAALEAVKRARDAAPVREDILVSRQFFAGTLVARR